MTSASRGPTVTYREQDGVHLTFMDGVRFGLGLMFSVWLISMVMLVLFVSCFGNPLAGLL